MLELDQLQPWIAPYARWLYQVAAYYGLRPVVTSVYRSPERQAELYAAFLRGETDLPVAPPGASQHGQRLAFDLVVDGDYRGEAQAWLGGVWSSIGGAWNAADPVHFAVRHP